MGLNILYSLSSRTVYSSQTVMYASGHMQSEKMSMVKHNVYFCKQNCTHSFLMWLESCQWASSMCMRSL